MGNIQFDHIVPKPLAEFISSDSLWKSNFSFQTNKYYQIIAPSGKGKSTLVGILAGTRGDFEGQLFFEGQNTKQYSPLDWSRWRAMKCSVVFQDLQLFPQLTALENIQLSTEIQAVHNVYSNSVSTEIITEWATTLGIDAKLNSKVEQLSFGQMQRVAILRALNRPFNWIVLDEPFSHLDENNSMKALNLIKEISQKNNAGIIITALDSRYSIAQFETITI